MTKAKRIGEVEGLGEIFQVAAPLDEQIESFKEEGIQAPYFPGVDDTAQIRIAKLSSDFTRTNVAPIGLKGKRTILDRNSILMNPAMASLAVQFHKRGEYLEMPAEFYEVVEQRAKIEEEKEIQPEDRTALILPFEGNTEITPEMDVSRFLFRKYTAPYFAQFTNGTIPFENLQADSKKAVVNYLWFNSPRSHSRVICGSQGLHYDDDALGVRVAEGGSRAVSSYDLTTIRNATSNAVARFLQERNITGLAKNLEGLDSALLEELRNVRK